MIAEARGLAAQDLYLESSAALSTVLREPSTAPQMDLLLDTAGRVFMSALGVVECHRVMLRGLARGRITALELGAAQHRLQLLLSRSDMIELEPSVIARACLPMSDNLIRSLDAIHVACALVARDVVGPLSFVSFDHRVRVVATQMGFSVLPLALPVT